MDEAVRWCKANGYAEALSLYQLDERSRQLGRLWTLDDFDLYPFPPPPANSAGDDMDIETDAVDEEYEEYEKLCEEVVEKNMNFVLFLEQHMRTGSGGGLCELVYRVIIQLQSTV